MTSNDPAHPRYKALMAGARDVLANHGLEGFTTGRIAKHAGIGQSAFYLYFPNRDACLAAVAQEIGQEILAILRTIRAAEIETGLVESFEASLNLLTVEHRQTIELFLRFKQDSGLLGATFRQLFDAAINEVYQDMVDSGYVEDTPRGRRLAHLTVGGVLGAVDAILDGRIDNVRDVAQDFGDIAMALITAGASS